MDMGMRGFFTNYYSYCNSDAQRVSFGIWLIFMKKPEINSKFVDSSKFVPAGLLSVTQSVQKRNEQP